MTCRGRSGTQEAQLRLDRPLAEATRLPRSSDDRAASRISSARLLSGTRCSRFVLVRVGGTVHTWSAVSILAHSAPRTSPDLAAVSTGNFERQLDHASGAGCPHRLDHRRRVPMRQRPHGRRSALPGRFDPSSSSSPWSEDPATHSDSAEAFECYHGVL